MTTQEKMERLRQIISDYPELVFNNDGYERLPKDIYTLRKPIISEINKILKTMILGFSYFQNFKPRKDGSVCVRCQYNWNAGTEQSQFIGVGYFTFEQLVEA